MYIYIYICIYKCSLLRHMINFTPAQCINLLARFEFSVCYGVATISRLLKITGLFCKRALQKRPILCKRRP